MPQLTSGGFKMLQINERLGNRSVWPMLCTSFRPMATPLSIAIIRAKEVREFPISLFD
jgi:hypothetical protein